MLNIRVANLINWTRNIVRWEKNMKAAFVILHYLAEKDTIECVQSILKNLCNNNYEIIIVDNYSDNGSLERLKECFQNGQNIHFIELESNVGFAKGNNAGYLYAKKFLKIEFIILINNDILVKQKDFLLMIFRKYRENKFDILGPDIISTMSGRHQNPIARKGLTETEITETIDRTKSRLRLNKIGYLGLKFKVFGFIKKVLNYKPKMNANDCFDKEIENVPLHGCCLIFSPNYIKKYNGLYSKTFMYAEEYILYYIAAQEKLKIVYWPEILIFHKEDAATNAYLKKGIKKRTFMYENSIDSYNKLRAIQNDNELYQEDIYDKCYDHHR